MGCGIRQGVKKPGQKLEGFVGLSSDEFVAEVKKRQDKGAGSLSPTALKGLRDSYESFAPNFRIRQGEMLNLERMVSELVNQAYGLTKKEIELMCNTAPPRMPGGRRREL